MNANRAERKSSGGAEPRPNRDSPARRRLRRSGAAPRLSPRPRDPRLDGIVKLAVLAVGGQGGSVLANWIERLARAEGYACQTTSVAGVAQRTGATIYYVEMAPPAEGEGDPVFSLAPSGGDVDILIAAELMEAGRAVMRGFVTPDRTVLIASTHRELAVSEKMTPGDGIADAEEVMAAAEIAARKLVAFDMEKIAVENGSVISASLFGALAGSGALPFGEGAFRDAIRSTGKGVEASVRAFDASFEASRSGHSDSVAPASPPSPTGTSPTGPKRQIAEWEALLSRIEALPEEARFMARLGLAKVVDFMDLDYGRFYLDRLDEAARGDSRGVRSREAAKWLANAMAYDDVIRVADLKTRTARRKRIESEMKVGEGGVMLLTDYFHPRAEEIVGLFPARLGAWIEARPKWMARIDRVANRGRRMRTDRLLPFLSLYLLGGLRRYRRRTHRHAIEMAHMERWMKLALEQEDYDLGVEILRCRRLIKGYSDTHERGLSKFDRTLEALNLLKGRKDASEWLARLREAALRDEKGEALDEAIETIKSFAQGA